MQPLDAPLFIVTGEGSFSLSASTCVRRNKKNCKESDSARFFSSLFFLFCKTAKISAVATESSVCSTRVRKRGKIFPFSRTCTSFFRREAECAHFSRPSRVAKGGKRETGALTHIRTVCVTRFASFARGPDVRTRSSSRQAKAQQPVAPVSTR